MKSSYNSDGRLQVAPREVREALARDLRGTARRLYEAARPHGIDPDKFFDVQTRIAEKLDVHPRCIIVRGSSHLGFSTTPRPAKVWKSTAKSSDLDLAIVDGHIFGVIDREVRRWDREHPSRSLNGDERKSRVSRERNHSSLCFRHFDLARIEGAVCGQYFKLIEELRQELTYLPDGGLSAFFFQDWWSLEERNVRDFQELLDHPALPQPGAMPRPRVLPPEKIEEMIAVETDICLDGELEFDASRHIDGICRAAKVERLWLDANTVEAAHLQALSRTCGSLKMLSLSERVLTRGQLDVVKQFQALKLLCLDRGTANKRLHELQDALPRTQLHVGRRVPKRKASAASASSGVPHANDPSRGGPPGG